MLRIGDAQIPWTPLLEVAQVMQRAMSLLVSIGRVTTPRTRVPDVVATVGDELGRRQVGGGCDPFTRVGAIRVRSPEMRHLITEYGTIV